MINLVIESLKDEAVSLNTNIIYLESELKEIEYRKELTIKGNEYHNGFYLLSTEYGFDEIVYFLKGLLSTYKKRLREIEENINGLIEKEQWKGAT